jgi:hypothetical protein
VWTLADGKAISFLPHVDSAKVRDLIEQAEGPLRVVSHRTETARSVARITRASQQENCTDLGQLN